LFFVFSFFCFCFFCIRSVNVQNVLCIPGFSMLGFPFGFLKRLFALLY
jgi:hypothetical protein